MMIHNLYNLIRTIFLSLATVFSVIVFLGVGNKVYATHASGSDLTYRWISGDTYEVTVSFYRDCQGVASPTTITLNVNSVSCGQSFSVTLDRIAVTGGEITFPCNPLSTYCNGGTNAGVQQYVFLGNVTLPMQCVDWVFSYSLCCRSCAITTITNQANCNNATTGNSLYVEATLNSVLANHNSSPAFTNIPLAFICANQLFTFNHGVVDSDGDSLDYSFIDPKRSQTVNVGFLPGFSATNWLTSSTQVSIDSSTGDISMSPTLIGQITVCAVLVKEYRNGVFIGSVIRDMQFWIKDCGGNMLPTATGINGTSNYSTVVCPGGSTCFTINSSDLNIGQHLLMTSTSTTYIPGSTFTIANQGGASPNYPIGTFCWSPTAADARDQPYTFTITILDDNCNYNAYQVYSYSILVPRHIITFATPTYNGYQISCNGGTNGSVTASVSGGQTPFTYLWSSGATTQTVSGLATGTYGITITDVNGCTKDTSVTLSEPTALSLSETHGAILCNGTTTGSVNLTVTGGITGYTYNWSNGETIEDIEALAAGTYTVTVTDANGCTATTSSTVTEPIVLSASVTSYTDTLGCNAVGTGAIDVSVSGGTAAYSYNWSNGATTQDLNNLGAGTYNITITDANGCTTTLTADLLIVQVGVPTATAVATDVTGCFGDTNGSIDLTVTDGQSPFTYNWSNGSTTEDLSGLLAGTYSVTVLDVNGCSTTTSAAISEPQLLVVSVSPFSTNVSCNGACDGTISLTISGGTSPYDYEWSNGATTASLSNLCPSAYDVTITDANGCTATTSSTVTEPIVLSASVTSYTDTLGCNAVGTGAIDVSVSGGTAAYSYNWSNGATTQDLNNLGAGTYNITITDANGCTTTLTADLLIVQVGVPTATAVATDVTGCFGDTNGSIDLTVTDGQSPFTYNWSNGSTTEDLSGLGAGTYNVTITDVNGCTATASATVNQPVVLSALSAIATNATCFGLDNGSIDLTPIGGAFPYSFEWSNGATTEDISGLNQGIYTVTVSDANGCTAIGTGNITEPDAIMIMANPVIDATCFGSADGIIDIAMMGGIPSYTFSWSNGATTEDLNNVISANYFVTVTDVNSCEAIDSFFVNEPTQLTATISITDSVYCAGIDFANIDLAVLGGTSSYNYNWSNGATTEDLINLVAGSYTIIITDANACTATANVNVTEPQPLAAIASESQAVDCNGNATGVAIVTASGGVTPYAYAWSTFSISDTITGLVAGTYFVTVTDANGCSNSTNVIINEPTILSVVIGSIIDINCQDVLSGVVDINVIGGTTPYTFSWSNAATTEDLSAIGAGTYFVTVTDAHGCTDTLSAVVDPVIIILGGINVDDTISCNGAGDGSLSVSITGGTAPYGYSWSNGATTQNITGLSGGTYSVTVTDAGGCSDEVSLQLVDPAVPGFTGGGITDVCGIDGTLTATLPGGYTGTWTLLSGTGNITDPALPVTTVTGLGSGTNEFIWIITNGTCTFADTATLQTTILTIDAGSEQSSCDSVNIQLNGSQSSGSGVWSSPDNGISFSDPSDPSATTSGLTEGSNIIIWTVSDGTCIEIDTVIITVKTPAECNDDSLEMPTGFSPNGDGPNDFFVIHGLVDYPENEFKVFSRWGNLVYGRSNYNNEWDGTNNKGEKLPDGTYFVIFEATNLVTPLSGYVDMRR